MEKKNGEVRKEEEIGKGDHRGRDKKNMGDEGRGKVAVMSERRETGQRHFSMRNFKHDVAEASTPKTPGHPFITANSPQNLCPTLREANTHTHTYKHTDTHTHSLTQYMLYLFLSQE